MGLQSRNNGAWVIALLLLLGACDESASVNYRMTVSINDNGRVVTRSAVRKEVWNQQHGNIDGNLLLVRAAGDAIVVPLHGRLLVVSMVDWSHASRGPERASPGCTGPGRADDGARCEQGETWSSMQAFRRAFRYVDTFDGPVLVRAVRDEADGREVEVRRNALPILLTFDGSPGLESLRAIDVDHLDDTFGPGVTLQRVTVAKTHDPVTRDLGASLPFVATLAGGLRSCWAATSANDPPRPDGSSQVINPQLGTCASKELFTG
jgi:hypothetical protein